METRIHSQLLKKMVKDSSWFFSKLFQLEEMISNQILDKRIEVSNHHGNDVFSLIEDHNFFDLNNVLPTLYKQSLYLIGYGYFEYMLNDICSKIQDIGDGYHYVNGKDKGIHKSHKYFKDVLNYKTPDLLNNGCKRKFLSAIRGSFIHSRGRLVRETDIENVPKWLNGWKGLDCVEIENPTNMLILSMSFVRITSEQFDLCLREVYEYVLSREDLVYKPDLQM